MTNVRESAADRSWEELTLREKIGQTMIMLPDRTQELERGGGSLAGFFERYPVSGFFMGWKLFEGVPADQWAEQVRRAVREYQTASRLPLLFQEDYEHGVDSRDQHLCTTPNTLPLDDWRRTSGRVFQELSDEGVMAIMPGHIALPAWQRARQEYLDGFHPPATLSSALLTDLLKREMGFRGVIVSDAMMMGGFRGWYATLLEGEIRSFLAGVDVMLWPSYGFMDELEARILRGEVPMYRLDDAVRRVWEMKRRLGLLDPEHELVRAMSGAEKAAAAADSSRIAERSLTLVRDRRRALPLDPARDRNLLVVGVTPRSRKGGDGGFEAIRGVRDLLASRDFRVDLQHNILYETDYWQSNLPDRYDRIIVVVIRSMHQPFGPLLFWDDEAQSVWGVNAMPKGKIIVVGMGSPYLVDEYFERVDTCINTYSHDESTRKALVRALLGEIPFAGVSPVRHERNRGPGVSS